MVGAERINLVAEAIMGKRKNRAVEPSEATSRLVEEDRREVERCLGPNATFEQRRDAMAAVMAEALTKAVYEDHGEDQAEGHRQPR